MPERRVEHATIRVERHFGAAPGTVYRAWVEPSGRDRWDVPGDGWQHVTEHRDVRVGGQDVIRFGPPEQLDFTGHTMYLELVTDLRILMSYTVTHRGVLWSASVLTVEFRAEEPGTGLTVTEQAAFLDGHDSADSRRRGFDDMFRHLDAHLAKSIAS